MRVLELIMRVQAEVPGSWDDKRFESEIVAALGGSGFDVLNLKVVKAYDAPDADEEDEP